MLLELNKIFHIFVKDYIATAKMNSTSIIMYFGIILLSACSPSGKDSNHEKSRKIERGFFGTALKKIPIDSIIGNWETTSIHFREYATNGTISRSYINKSDRINLEFTSDKKLLMNQDTIGIWFEKDNYLIIEGQIKSGAFPLFLNTHYRFNQLRFYATLTCFFSDRNGPHHQVRYHIIRKKRR